MLADNIDGIYTNGKQILAKYPNNLNIKYVIGGTNEKPDDQWKVVLEDRNSVLL